MSKGSKRKFNKNETLKSQDQKKSESTKDSVIDKEENKDLLEEEATQTQKKEEISEFEDDDVATKDQEDVFDQEEEDEKDDEREEKSASSEEEKNESPEEKSDRLKTLTSVLIIVVGLFVGSLFIDTAQLVTGKGLSSRVLETTDIFSLNDKTWVSFEEPITKVSVLVDDTCEECDPSQALLFLRRYIPTMLASEVKVSSNEGKKLIEDMGVTALPAFVFDKKIVETDFYSQAAQLFVSKENNSFYSLDIAQLGIPVGKYLVLPEVKENDIAIGSENAPVTIVEYSDFQCPYCQMLHTSLSKVLKEYGDKIRFVYKHLPLDFHPQAQNAALASECANEQEKFLPYADYLFSNQKEWGETEGLAIFKRYASTLGLNVAQFNRCVDENTYGEKIATDAAEAQSFGINGTPGMFINDSFSNGAMEYEALKQMIEKELSSQEK